jgi:hypothetical protein
MAKPPFKYRPSKPPAGGSDQRLPLSGSDEVPAVYTDLFVVVNEGEAGLGSIYFYQRRLLDREVGLGTTDTIRVSGATAKAICVGRVILSQQGIEKLMEALAENRGFTVTRKVTSEEKSE